MRLEKTDKKYKNQSKRLQLEKTEKKNPEQEIATGEKKRGGKKKTAQGLSK